MLVINHLVALTLIVYIRLLDWKLLEGRGFAFCFSLWLILKNPSINTFRLVDLSVLSQFTSHHLRFYKFL